MQLHLADGGRTRWGWHYVKTVMATYARHIKDLPPTIAAPSFVDTLASRFMWPAEPDTEVVDLQVIRVKAFLVYILAVIAPARYAGCEANFFSKMFTQILETYYKRTILGKTNIASHLKWTERESKAATKESKPHTWTSKGSNPKTSKSSHPSKREPAASGKRARDTAAEPAEAPPSKDPRTPAEHGASSRQYDKCQKCLTPVPMKIGGRSSQKFCLRCREK